MATKNFVNLEDLALYKSLYDEQVADAIATAEARSLHTVTIVGSTLKFYREEEPVGQATPAYEITLPNTDLSNLIEKIANAQGGRIASTKADGTIEESNIQISDVALDSELSAVAKSGDASDVNYNNSNSGLISDDIQGAIDELANASQGGAAAKTVWFRDDSSGQSEYAKVYRIYQGANAPEAQTTPATLLGTINVPLDKVVQDGHLVTVESGVDSDGDTVPSGIDDGTYIKLTFQNVSAPAYINVQDLVDAYTGGTTTEATVNISNSNEITVTLGAVDGSKIVNASIAKGKLASGVQTSLGLADTALQDADLSNIGETAIRNLFA